MKEDYNSSLPFRIIFMYILLSIYLLCSSQTHLKVRFHWHNSLALILIHTHTPPAAVNMMHYSQTHLQTLFHWHNQLYHPDFNTWPVTHTSSSCFLNSLFLLTDSARRDSSDAIFSSRTSTLLFRVSSSMDSRALQRLGMGKRIKCVTGTYACSKVT